MFTIIPRPLIALTMIAMAQIEAFAPPLMSSQLPRIQPRIMADPIMFNADYDTKRHIIRSSQQYQRIQQQRGVRLYAGGFEWDDPTETMLDQGVENPFKNPTLLNPAEDADSSNMKIDPARLLSPRLNGSNLYFIGMMGSGKSSIAKIVAKRTYLYKLCKFVFNLQWSSFLFCFCIVSLMI